MSKEKQIDSIIDLLTDFDEMGFAPTTTVPDPEAYAIEWRKKMTDALQGFRKQSENVIELPCRVGDTVYLPWAWKDTSGIAILTVERISITEAGKSIRTDFWSDDEGYWLAYNCGVYKFEDFDKIVFLTKEGAEEALAKMKGGAE